MVPSRKPSLIPSASVRSFLIYKALYAFVITTVLVTINLKRGNNMLSFGKSISRKGLTGVMGVPAECVESFLLGSEIYES
jgi:hypothetical protein